MIPDEKGWLKTFYSKKPTGNLEELKTVFKEKSLSIYSLVQPTGLMYGFPTAFSFDYRFFDKLTSKHKLKIILADSLLNTYLVARELESYNQENLSDFYNSVIRFYSGYDTGLLEKHKLKHSLSYKVEQILNERVNVSSGTGINIWSFLFHNSFLYLDVIYYFQSICETKDKGLHKHPDELKLFYLKIIASVAVKNDINAAEKNLFKGFLESAKLNIKNREHALRFFSEPELTDISLIEIPQNYLARKFALDLACLTAWVDKTLSGKEEQYLKSLTDILMLNDDDLRTSLAAIEIFINKYTSDIPYLKNKNRTGIITGLLYKRLSIIINKNKDFIIREIKESKELVLLLNKATKEDLTEEEKRKVKAQLTDILKGIPAFAIFMLPGGAVLLPLVLKILPKNILSLSSFHD